MIGAVIAKRLAGFGFNALNRRDLDRFMADWAEDATFIYPGNVSASGEIKGKEAIEAWFQRFLDQFPGIEFAVKKVFVSNIFAIGAKNEVAVEWDAALTNREGKYFQNSGVTTIRVNVGKAILIQDYISDTSVFPEAWGED